MDDRNIERDGKKYTPEQMHAATWPECSGFPQSCPENEGYGCCMGNKPVLRVVQQQENGCHD